MPELCYHSQKEFLQKQRRKKVCIALIRIFLFAAFLVFWETGSRVGWFDSFFFSSPFRLLKCMLRLLDAGILQHHLRITLMETLITFSLVIGIALLLAILLWWNSTLSAILEPYLVILNSLPKSALAPLFIVWFGNSMSTIIIAGVSVAVFGATMTLYQAFSQMEPDAIKLITTLGGRKHQVLTKLLLPGSLGTLFNVMKVNMGLSLVGVIIGEFLAANAGLGYMIIYGSQTFQLDYVLLAIVLLCIVAAVLYLLLDLLCKRFHAH